MDTGKRTSASSTMKVLVLLALVTPAMVTGCLFDDDEPAVPTLRLTVKIFPDAGVAFNISVPAIVYGSNLEPTPMMNDPILRSGNPSLSFNQSTHGLMLRVQGKDFCEVQFISYDDYGSAGIILYNVASGFPTVWCSAMPGSIRVSYWYEVDGGDQTYRFNETLTTGWAEYPISIDDKT